LIIPTNTADANPLRVLASAIEHHQQQGKKCIMLSLPRTLDSTTALITISTHHPTGNRIDATAATESDYQAA
jgi:hypothetical protein